MYVILGLPAEESAGVVFKNLTFMEPNQTQRIRISEVKALRLGCLKF